MNVTTKMIEAGFNQAREAYFTIDDIKAVYEAMRGLDPAYARLRDALGPFAEYADPHNNMPPTLPVTRGSGLARRQITMGDCYMARAALEARDVRDAV